MFTLSLLQARNESMMNDRRAGMSISDLAKKYVISRSRADQVVKKCALQEKKRETHEAQFAGSVKLEDDVLLSDLKLTSRAANYLKLENIQTVGELRAKTDQELLRIPNFGRKSLKEVRSLTGECVPNHSESKEAKHIGSLEIYLESRDEIADVKLQLKNEKQRLDQELRNIRSQADRLLANQRKAVSETHLNNIHFHYSNMIGNLEMLIKQAREQYANALDWHKREYPEGQSDLTA